MTKDIDTLMDRLYHKGEISIDKEKVNLLNIFLQRAFPHVGKRAIADAAALLAVYSCLLVDGKRISVNGQELDADGFSKLFDTYGKKAASEFGSEAEMYDFYGAAVVVALYVYKYTAGLTNKELMFKKTHGGDYSDRISAAMNGE